MESKQIIIPQELVEKYTRKIEKSKGLFEIRPIKVGDHYTLPPEVLELDGMEDTLKEMVDKKIITKDQTLDKLSQQIIPIPKPIEGKL